MRNSRRPKSSGRPESDETPEPLAPPRIIGGTMRGRKLLYSGDPRTRPMKDRVREAAFNLIGPTVAGKTAIDLFAGTGALGFEALSRGAASALFVEQHFPTGDLIRRTAAELGVAERIRVVSGSAFIWAKRDLPATDRGWVVFVSPPWALFPDRREQMIELINDLIAGSPPESVLIVEADEHAVFQELPQPESWDVRAYSPAVLGILRK
jgi:16S rRNA (guanine966-N2)-methyltransferase